MTNKDIVRGTSKVCSPANKENIQVQISWLLKYTPFQTWNEQNNLRSFDKAGINFILLIFIHRSAREKTNKKKSDRIKNLNQRFSITKIVQRSNRTIQTSTSIDRFFPFLELSKIVYTKYKKKFPDRQAIFPYLALRKKLNLR